MALRRASRICEQTGDMGGHDAVLLSRFLPQPAARILQWPGLTARALLDDRAASLQPGGDWHLVDAPLGQGPRGDLRHGQLSGER